MVDQPRTNQQQLAGLFLPFDIVLRIYISVEILAG